VVIDLVLDFDIRSGRTGIGSAGTILAAAERASLRILWVLETHLHADHLSAAQHVKAASGAKIAIGDGIGELQAYFKRLLNVDDCAADGSEFDRLLHDGERLPLGASEIEIMQTPGHTPICVSYRIGDAVFVGDTLFMPDYGTARTGFHGGDASALYRSIRRLLALPPETHLFMCRDCKAPGRDRFPWETTVAEERARNTHIREEVSEGEFVAMRCARDRTLLMPALILPAIQVNMRAGRLPPAESNGGIYLKLPRDRL